MIYIVPNFVENTTTYFCPDQATIDAGSASGFFGNLSVGTEADANVLIQQNRTAYLPLIESMFVVNKDVNPDPVNTTWVVCSLDSEQPNTDIDYNVFDPKNGIYNLATGLDNAKALLEQIKQDYLSWSLPVGTFETWPKNKRQFPTAL